MAVSKKHHGTDSQKSGISKPTTQVSGAGKSLGKKRVASSHRKSVAYVQKSSAPFQATILEKVVDIDCDADTDTVTSLNTPGIVENEFKLTVLTKEELESSRIKAYSYIL